MMLIQFSLSVCGRHNIYAPFNFLVENCKECGYLLSAIISHMRRLLIPILVTLIALGIFLIVKNFIGLKLGLRTYFPVFIAIFFYSLYIRSISAHKKEKEKSDD